MNDCKFMSRTRWILLFSSCLFNLSLFGHLGLKFYVPKAPLPGEISLKSSQSWYARLATCDKLQLCSSNSNLLKHAVSWKALKGGGLQDFRNTTYNYFQWAIYNLQVILGLEIQLTTWQIRRSTSDFAKDNFFQQPKIQLTTFFGARYTTDDFL